MSKLTTIRAGRNTAQKASGDETARSKAIREALAVIGVLAVRVQSGRVRVPGGWMHLAPAGTPDHVLRSPAGWLETKTPATDLNDAQREWHRRCQVEGGRVACVRTVEDAVRVVVQWRHEDERMGRRE
jgi:hypothetical protein